MLARTTSSNFRLRRACDSGGHAALVISDTSFPGPDIPVLSHASINTRSSKFSLDRGAPAAKSRETRYRNVAITIVLGIKVRKVPLEYRTGAMRNTHECDASCSD